MAMSSPCPPSAARLAAWTRFMWTKPCGEVGGGVTWDPGEQEGEGDHKEGAGVGSVPLQL